MKLVEIENRIVWHCRKNHQEASAFEKLKMAREYLVIGVTFGKAKASVCIAQILAKGDIIITNVYF